MVDVEDPILWFGIFHTSFLVGQAILRFSGAGLPDRIPDATVQLTERGFFAPAIGSSYWRESF
jgi:hypothetical protein